jgi:hypothetical protein
MCVWLVKFLEKTDTTPLPGECWTPDPLSLRRSGLSASLIRVFIWSNDFFRVP